LELPYRELIQCQRTPIHVLVFVLSRYNFADLEVLVNSIHPVAIC